MRQLIIVVRTAKGQAGPERSLSVRNGDRTVCMVHLRPYREYIVQSAGGDRIARRAFSMDAPLFHPDNSVGKGRCKINVMEDR